MKEYGAFVARILFYMLVFILTLWTSSLTLEFVGRVLPTIQIAKYFALIVFDIGMFVWLFVFLMYASGLVQRVLSASMAIFDMIGVGVMVFAELLTGGQTLITPPEDLGGVAIWAIGIWTFANIGATILFHVADPEVQHAMAVKTASDKIVKMSLDEMSRRMDELSTRVADSLSKSMVRNALQSLMPNAPSHQFQQVTAQATKDVVETAVAEAEKGAEIGRCLHIKPDGTQCTRKVRNGASYCFQHNKKK